MNTSPANNTSQYPKGKLVAVGGAIDHDEPHKHILTQYEEGILASIVHLLPRKKQSAIEIIASASHIPDEAVKDYIDCFKKWDCPNTNHLKITNREEAGE